MPSIIAAGFIINNDLIQEYLQKYVSEKYEFEVGECHYGLYYSDQCKVGRWTGIQKSQQGMKDWYNEHINRENIIYFTDMYVTSKVIVLVGTFEGNPFLIVPCNMSQGGTFIHKKNANNGHYGKPIPIDKFSICGEPYLYTK